MTTIGHTRVEIAERLTAKDFWHLALETQKAELVEGVMIVASPASKSHELLFGFLLGLLGEFVKEGKLGTVLGSRTAVELAPDQVYEPDLLFVSKERANIIRESGIFGPPDFVIEILSVSTAAHDRGNKLRGYERAGVRELWLIDPYGPAGTEFYRLEGERYVPVAPEPNGVLRSVAIAGFSIQVNWLWPAEEFLTVRAALEEINQQ